MFNFHNYQPETESELHEVIQDLSQNESRIRKALGSMSWKAKALFRLILAYSKGTYRDVPWKTIATATGALIYFVTPIDAIPDIIPGLGFADDAIVIATVASACAVDIGRFLSWESAKRG